MIQSPPPRGGGGGASGAGADPDAIEARPPWHWVGFGAVAIFAAWLPLAYVAQGLGERLVTRRFEGLPREEAALRLAALSTGERLRVFAPLAAMHLLALALAATAGGFLVGRYGSGSTLREPALAGGVVALMAITLSASSGSVANLIATGAVTFLVAVGGAALGGRRGLARRAKGAPQAPKP